MITFHTLVSAKLKRPNQGVKLPSGQTGLHKYCSALALCDIMSLVGLKTSHLPEITNSERNYTDSKICSCHIQTLYKATRERGHC